MMMAIFAYNLRMTAFISHFDQGLQNKITT